MLQVLVFAPYVALASSFVLAGTVAMICFSQRAQPLQGKGFSLRKRRMPIVRGTAPGAGPTPTGASSRSARKKSLEAAA
ncbi:MAG TPA: hypothetical protein VFK79_10780 [Xanthobacteraceae bacterium]|nr:hypothetical protein [Xanthobacteraceae bacterium]